MNIVVNGFMDQRTWPIVLKVIEALKVDSFVYTYNYFKPNLAAIKSKKTLLSWRKINFYGDYDVDWNLLEPLDEELIDSMRDCEAVVLKMMDRLETLKDYSYSDRKELYLKHLRYWNDLIAKDKIDLFISSNVPHETSDFVCYSLCKLKNIPTIIVCQTHIPDTCLVFDDWEKTDYGLPGAFNMFKGERNKKTLGDTSLSPIFENYYNMQTSAGEAAPFYMKKKSLAEHGSKKVPEIVKKVKNNPRVYLDEGPVIIKALSRKFVVSLKTKSLMRYYEKKCSRFDPSSKYIFVALHVQPEMSTSPRADAYVEQIMMLELLSSCVPSNVKIFVKEHPNQNSLSRSKKYYDEILKIRNVRLMSRRINSRDLVQNSLAVSTCVGLVGFESLFRGKPVLMFGHDFFQRAPGVFSIRTKTDLEKAIKEIIKGGVFSQKEFKLFLKALERVSIHGTVDSDYLPTSSISDGENTENIARGILDEYAKTLKKQ